MLVRGVYNYQAQGPNEISLQEGEVIRLTSGPTGGRNFADGWWEGKRTSHDVQLTRSGDLMGTLIVLAGIDASGKKGIFPSNYVRARPTRLVLERSILIEHL